MLFQKILRKQVVPAVIILLLLVPGTYAQEEEAVQTGGSKAAWRIGFWEILHQTFSSDDLHPFYQMTGTNRFKGGKGFFGLTTLDPEKNNLTPNIYNKNDDEHGSKDGFLTKLFSNIPLLKGLPSFSLEYILPTDYDVGIGLAFAYTNIWLDDKTVRAATQVPIQHMQHLCCVWLLISICFLPHFIHLEYQDQTTWIFFWVSDCQELRVL